MPDAEVILVAGAAVGLAAGFVYYDKDLASRAFTTGSVLLRLLLVAAGIAALATGQVFAGFLILFGVTLYFLTQRPDEEVLG